jgi:hydroxymethylbilane synthase
VLAYEQEALLAGASSFAVHSLKDMPTALPTGLVLGAICNRESPEDAAIIHPKHKANGVTSLSGLPEGSIIGTSSLRREALLRSLHPTFEIKTIRGNIQTRLAKLDEHDDYDAIIVAACGFRRGGLGDRIDEVGFCHRVVRFGWIVSQSADCVLACARQLLPLDSFGYGVGQGSIGIECRANDTEVGWRGRRCLLRQPAHRTDALNVYMRSPRSSRCCPRLRTRSQRSCARRSAACCTTWKAAAR